MALDVSGLTTHVARGERARFEWVIGWFTRVSAPVPHPVWIGEWGCTTGMWGWSVALRKLTGTSPFHPERVGPSCMARFFFFFFFLRRCVRGAHSERKPVRREFGLVWGHGHVHMNRLACSFVRAGAVRMCIVLVRGLGMGCVLPTGRGVRLRGL